jgi:hypothetical protein
VTIKHFLSQIDFRETSLTFVGTLPASARPLKHSGRMAPDVMVYTVFTLIVTGKPPVCNSMVYKWRQADIHARYIHGTDSGLSERVVGEDRKTRTDEKAVKDNAQFTH